jgi:hypothetical protein
MCSGMHVAMDNTMTYAHICPLVHFHLPHPPGHIPAEDLFAGSVAADKWFLSRWRRMWQQISCWASSRYD